MPGSVVRFVNAETNIIPHPLPRCCGHPHDAHRPVLSGHLVLVGARCGATILMADGDSYPCPCELLLVSGEHVAHSESHEPDWRWNLNGNVICIVGQCDEKFTPDRSGFLQSLPRYTGEVPS